MNIQTIKSLNKLKNASLIKNESVVLEYSFLVLNIIQSLYKEGFIQSFKIKNLDSKTNKQVILVNLRYYFNKPVFKRLKIFSNVAQNRALDIKI